MKRLQAEPMGTCQNIAGHSPHPQRSQCINWKPMTDQPERPQTEPTQEAVKWCEEHGFGHRSVTFSELICCMVEFAASRSNSPAPTPVTTKEERESAAWAGEGLAEEGFKAGNWDNDFVARLAKDCIALIGAGGSPASPASAPPQCPKCALTKVQQAAAVEAERENCQKALLALAGVEYVTPAEGYGTNSSWAISDLCRAVKQFAGVASAPSEPRWVDPKETAPPDREVVQVLHRNFVNGELTVYVARLVDGQWRGPENNREFCSTILGWQPLPGAPLGETPRKEEK